MIPSYGKPARKYILPLLLINILVGILIFRNYGYSWDEPLFYDYADALGYAYTPQEWISGSFDLSNAYGPSGDDHKTRGPAYLLLARGPVALLQMAGIDRASAWHLTNFLFFQLGVYFLFRLAVRWVKPAAALSASALFAWQPLLWGHAFINPKDPPFLVFFLGAVCLGFVMVDRLSDEATTTRQRFSRVMLPAIFLGIATSIRVLGPLAGLLVLTYAVWRFGRKILAYLPPLLLYGILALVVMLFTWPFLWQDPVARFTEVFRFMSDNPTNLSVLFGGEVVRAGDLPRRYLPVMLGITLTEPVWLLFLVGLLAGYWKFLRHAREPRVDSSEGWQSLRSSLETTTARTQLVSLTLVLLWFLLLAGYVLWRRPALYDGIRHFLFILPPIFIFTGFAFELLLDRHAYNWLYAVIALALLVPGILGIVRLHPYEYTYYNSFVGGTGGAFRQYETDYWLTCYKGSVEQLNRQLSEPVDLYVQREGYIAAYYAGENLTVRELRGALNEVGPGDYVLVNTRSNEDRLFREVEPTLQVGRAGAIFCVVKEIP